MNITKTDFKLLYNYIKHLSHNDYNYNMKYIKSLNKIPQSNNILHIIINKYPTINIINIITQIRNYIILKHQLPNYNINKPYITDKHNIFGINEKDEEDDEDDDEDEEEDEDDEEDEEDEDEEEDDEEDEDIEEVVEEENNVVEDVIIENIVEEVKEIPVIEKDEPKKEQLSTQSKLPKKSLTKLDIGTVELGLDGITEYSVQLNKGGRKYWKKS